jgi:hypothetical protein
MKTSKQNLNAIALGVALAMGSMTALAAPFVVQPAPNPAAPGAVAIVAAELAAAKPTFNSNEKVGLCLIESTVSMLAARTNDFGCDKATYDLHVETSGPYEGIAELDGGVVVGGTTLEGRLFPTRDIGTKCKVDDADGMNLVGSIELRDYNGAHGWSRSKEIFNSDAYIKIKDPQSGSVYKYKEVDIKDFFKYVIPDEFGPRSWEFDWGLEDIKKFREATSTSPEFYYPVQKWQELSWYRHENGFEGGLWVKKFQVSPRRASGLRNTCTIRVEASDGNVNNTGGTFTVDAKVTVSSEPVGPL